MTRELIDTMLTLAETVNKRQPRSYVQAAQVLADFVVRAFQKPSNTCPVCGHSTEVVEA